MEKLMLAALIAGATVTLAHAATATKADSATAKNLADDTAVQLSGEITQHLHGDHYLLRDNAGTIEVEIDDDLTHHRKLQNGTQVDITGEVDHDDGQVLVEATRVNTINGEAPLQPGLETNSAAINKGMAEDTKVRLKGEIAKHLHGDHYLLRDSAGTIEVEIDDDLTHRQRLQNGTQVDISGEIDHDDGRVLVDVKRVNSLTAPK